MIDRTTNPTVEEIFCHSICHICDRRASMSARGDHDGSRIAKKGHRHEQLQRKRGVRQEIP